MRSLTGTRGCVAALAVAGVLALAAVPARRARADQTTRNLSTDFVEVLVEGVPIGSRYTMVERPVEARNGGSIDLRIRYDVQVPEPAFLRPGYEPIPEPSWVSFEPRTFTVTPSGVARGNVVLYVPDDPSLVGRRFQATLFIHTDESQPGLVGIGLRPRLFFSVREKATGEKPKKIVVNPVALARIQPYEIGATAGDLVFDCGTLRSDNFWPEVMTCEIVKDPRAIDHIDVSRYETPVPDLSWVETSPDVLVLQPYSHGEIAVRMRVPFEARNFGRIFVAALHTVVKRKGEKPVDAWNKVRVTVPDPGLSRTGTGAKP